MAELTLSSNCFVRPHRTRGAPVLLSFPLGSTASTAVFKQGDAVARGATTNAHRIVNLTTGVTGSLTTFLGFAAESVTSTWTVGDPVLVYPAHHNMEYAGIGKGTFASTQLGQNFHLRRDSTLEIAYVNLGSTGNATCITVIVTDFLYGSTQGDTNGWVSFIVADAAMQMYRSSS